VKVLRPVIGVAIDDEYGIINSGVSFCAFNDTEKINFRQNAE